MLKKIISLSLVGSLLFANLGWARQTRTGEVYTIKRGDTLWDIAGEFLGDPFKWRKLWRYDGNRYIRNPHWIYPGNPLIIPTREEKGVSWKGVGQIGILEEEIGRLKTDVEGLKEGLFGRKQDISSLEEARKLRQRIENIEAALLSHNVLLEKLNIDEIERRITILEDDSQAIKKRMAINEVAADEEYQKIESEIVAIGENIYKIKEIVIEKEEKEKQRKGSTGEMAPYLLIAVAFGAIALVTN